MGIRAKEDDAVRVKRFDNAFSYVLQSVLDLWIYNWLSFFSTGHQMSSRGEFAQGLAAGLVLLCICSGCAVNHLF